MEPWKLRFFFTLFAIIVVYITSGNSQCSTQDTSQNVITGVCPDIFGCNWEVSHWKRWTPRCLTNLRNRTWCRYELHSSKQQQGYLQSKAFIDGQKPLCLTFKYCITTIENNTDLTVWIRFPGGYDQAIWKVSGSTANLTEARIPIIISGHFYVMITSSRSNAQIIIMIDDVTYNWTSCSSSPEGAVITTMVATMTSTHYSQSTSEVNIKDNNTIKILVGVIVSFTLGALLAIAVIIIHRRPQGIFCKRAPQNAEEERHRETFSHIFHAAVNHIHAGGDTASNSIDENTIAFQKWSPEYKSLGPSTFHCSSFDNYDNIDELKMTLKPSIENSSSQDNYDTIEELRSTPMPLKQHSTHFDNYDNIEELMTTSEPSSQQSTIFVNSTEELWSAPESPMNHSSRLDNYENLQDNYLKPSVQHKSPFEYYDHLEDKSFTLESSVHHIAPCDNYDHLEDKSFTLESSVHHIAPCDNYDHLEDKSFTLKSSVHHIAPCDNYDHLEDKSFTLKSSVHHIAPCDNYDHLESIHL